MRTASGSPKARKTQRARHEPAYEGEPMFSFSVPWVRAFLLVLLVGLSLQVFMWGPSHGKFDPVKCEKLWREREAQRARANPSSVPLVPNVPLVPDIRMLPTYVNDQILHELVQRATAQIIQNSSSPIAFKLPVAIPSKIVLPLQKFIPLPTKDFLNASHPDLLPPHQPIHWLHNESAHLQPNASGTDSPPAPLGPPIPQAMPASAPPPYNPLETLYRVDFDPTLYPNAVCNDGTMSGFYVSNAVKERAGAGARGQTWVVYLQGGGWCFDRASCLGRMGQLPHYMSSKPWAPTRADGGLLGPDPAMNPLWNASKVYLPYCTSDGYVGNRGASPETYGWHFRGQVVVESMFAELVRSFGLKTGDTLVFSGCSAGGRGALYNLDYVPAMIPDGIRVVGIFDAAIWVVTTNIILPQQTAMVLSLANATGRLGERCVAHFPNENEHWKCLYGEFRAQFISLPFLAASSQYDSFQLFTALQHMEPYRPDEWLFIENFRAAMRSALSNLPKGRSVFSTGCWAHCLTETELFWERPIVEETTGLTINMRDLITMTIFKNNFDSKSFGAKLMAQCTGFQCSCPGTPQV